MILAGIKAVVSWCAEVVRQAKDDWKTFDDLRKQYKNFDPDELW